MTNLRHNLSLKGLSVLEMPYDGSCFFHAIFRALQQRHHPALPRDAYDLRQVVCTFLQANIRVVCPDEDIAPLELTAYASQCHSMEEYIALMRDYGTFPDYLIIAATQKLYAINIDVVFDIHDRVERIGSKSERDDKVPLITIGNMVNYHFVVTKPLV